MASAAPFESRRRKQRGKRRKEGIRRDNKEVKRKNQQKTNLAAVDNRSFSNRREEKRMTLKEQKGIQYRKRAKEYIRTTICIEYDYTKIYIYIYIYSLSKDKALRYTKTVLCQHSLKKRKVKERKEEYASVSCMNLSSVHSTNPKPKTRSGFG